MAEVDHRGSSHGPEISGLCGGRRPRIGLALGGGAAFGGMHVGVIAGLHEAGIEADVVAGTSAGAFVGAFYAGGTSPEEMIERAVRLRWAELRRHLLPMRALMSNDRMATWLRRNLPVVDFDAMPKPFAVVTTDILCGSMVVLASEQHNAVMQMRALGVRTADKVRHPASTAETLSDGLASRVVWDTAPVPLAVAASSAIPVIFEPVRVGERLLVDGGVATMVPGSVARWLGADVVIGVDILPPKQVFTAPRTIVEYAIQAHRISAQWAVRNRSIHAEVVLRPRAANGRWNDMRQMQELVETGRAEAAAAMPEIRRRIAQAARRCPVADLVAAGAGG